MCKRSRLRLKRCVPKCWRPLRVGSKGEYGGLYAGIDIGAGKKTLFDLKSENSLIFATLYLSNSASLRGVTGAPIATRGVSRAVWKEKPVRCPLAGQSDDAHFRGPNFRGQNFRFKSPKDCATVVCGKSRGERPKFATRNS